MWHAFVKISVKHILLECPITTVISEKWIWLKFLQQCKIFCIILMLSLILSNRLTLTYNKQLTNLIWIYRPPPSKKNKFSDSMFFDQFSDFLEHSDSLPGKTLLMGDFNFHFENVENKNSRKLHDIIDMFNLTQSVSEPTHNQGHLLDLECFPSKVITSSLLQNYIWPHSHLVQTWCICTCTKT